MKTHARTLIVGLASLALAAAVASLYVHYQMLADPSYISFCDVSETISCEGVMTSRYGSLFGVSVAVGGAIWSALVLILGLVGMRASVPAQGVAGKAGGQPKGVEASARVASAASTTAL